MDIRPLRVSHNVTFRGSRKGLPLSCCRKAFTLVETLLVLSIIASMVGVLLLSAHSSWLEPGNEKAVAREAEYFSRWVDNIVLKACLNKRSFQFIYLPCSTPVSKIYVKWPHNNSMEVYDSEGKCYFTVRGSSVTQATYSPQWHTISPGFTLKAVVSPSKTGAVRYVRISPYSLVSVTDDPPLY